ncbi:hypothetical protein LguiA_010693 [Lonicera macranthoides]
MYHYKISTTNIYVPLVFHNTCIISVELYLEAEGISGEVGQIGTAGNCEFTCDSKRGSHEPDMRNIYKGKAMAKIEMM